MHTYNYTTYFIIDHYYILTIQVVMHYYDYKPTPRFAQCRLALVYYRRCAAPTPSRRWRTSAECHALQSQVAR